MRSNAPLRLRTGIRDDLVLAAAGEMEEQMEQAEPLSALMPLRIEYFQEITNSICDELLKAGASIPADASATLDRISQALESLRKVNQHPVELEKIGSIPTVPFAHLNKELLRIDKEHDNADDWWTEFDRTFPDYAGFASSSRVGFSDDRQVAIVYFSWTAGPTLGLGYFHILEKEKNDWKLIGGFRLWNWTS